MGNRVQYDVVVAGAGVAGVAAALAAARGGARTALVEKLVVTGGLATAGNVNMYLPLCDGVGTQVTYGIAEELLRACFAYGPGGIPGDWQEPASRSRLRSVFSPASFVLAINELLEKGGVEVWYDSLACEPLLDGPRVSGVTVENKSGRTVLEAGCTVDATGDADIAWRAGVPCEEGENYLTAWTLQASLESARQAAEAGSGRPLLEMYRAGASDTGAGHPEHVRLFSGINGRDVSEFIRESHRLVRERYRDEQSRLGADGRSDLFPLALPTMANYRTTRCIEGRLKLNNGDAWRRFDDAVGVVADWRGGGGYQRDVWEVPYGALIPRKLDGLLTAGRCIAATREAWAVMRVIPGAAHTGEIAGTAAALCARHGCQPAALRHSELVDTLRASGLRCSLPEVYGESYAQRRPPPSADGGSALSWDHT